MNIVSLKLRIVFLESAFHGKTGLFANHCKVPQRHLQCFKTWNDFDISLQNSWPVQNPGKQPSSVNYYLYHPVTMQERAEQRATFLLNVELLYVLASVQSLRGSGAPHIQLLYTAMSLTSKLNTYQAWWSPQTCWTKLEFKCCCSTLLVLDVSKTTLFPISLNLKYLNSYKGSWDSSMGFGML